MDFKVERAEDGPEIYAHARCHPICSDDLFIATIEPTSLIVWGKHCHVIKSTEHRKAILSICVSLSSQPYLCSCSADKVIIWEMNELAKGSHVPGMLVGVDLGVVNHCALSPNNSWLALCRETDLWVVELKHQHGNLSAVSHFTTLDSGGTTTSLCCFSPVHANVLITTDDSNTFKVWCVVTGRVLQRMAVGGWQRLSFCEFVPRGTLQGHLLVGTNHGELHLFAVSPCRPPRDLGHVTAGPPPPVRVPAGSGSADSCEPGCVVFSAILIDRSPPGEDEDADDVLTELCPEPEDPTVKAIIAPGALLLVCSNLGVGVYDCNSWTCFSFHPYQELLEKCPPLLTGAVVTGCSPEHIRCLLSWPGACCLLSASCSETQGCSPGLSFLGMSSASARSPLRAQFSRPAVEPARAVYGGNKATAPRPVKSSGYGTVAPRTQRFTPAVNARGRREPPPKPARRAALASGVLARLGGDLVRGLAPPLQQRAKITIWHDFGTAVRLASSGDGVSLACSSGPSAGPGVLSVLRWGSPDVDGCVRFAGHDARITSVGFSADSCWLVTGAGDGTTKVWDWRNRRCALDIGSGVNGTSSSSVKKSSATCSRAPAHGHGEAVAQAAFYYMDRFIVRAVGGALELFCHRLQEQLEDGLKQGFGVRSWRRVRRIPFPTQQVLCFIAPNSFYSNLVLGGCASRSLHVYDMDAERFLLELRDAHPRAPHALGVASPSQSPSSADLFLSTAICDGVKLWDLRQARCVQKFMRHLNRAHSCGAALSPCCKYLAVGSEDKCVYVYDTRNSRDFADKLFGLNEVVMDVVWNSCRPLLAASALNNAVALYGEHCLDQ